MMKIISARRLLVFALLIFSLTLFACGDSDNMGNEEHEHVAGEWKVTTPPTKNKNGVRSSVSIRGQRIFATSAPTAE